MNRLKTIDGFSFVEVIAVLVIIVVISAIIVSRSGSFSTDLVSQTEILKTHLRYAQTMGMSGTDSDDIFGIKCADGFYWLFKGTIPESNIIMLPDDQRYNTGDDGKLNLAEKKISIGTAFTVFFDQRGIPYSSYPDETTNTPYSEDLLINVTPAVPTGAVESIYIKPLTGFVP